MTYPPQFGKHPTDGETEVCVSTPELLITRDWHWKTFWTSSMQQHLTTHCNFPLHLFGGAFGSNLWNNQSTRRSPPEQFLLWEFECMGLDREIPPIDAVVTITTLNPSGIGSEPIKISLLSMATRPGRARSLSYVFPHPYRIENLPGLQIGIGLDSAYHTGTEWPSSRFYLHGYHGVMTSKSRVACPP